MRSYKRSDYRRALVKLPMINKSVQGIFLPTLLNIEETCSSKVKTESI